MQQQYRTPAPPSMEGTGARLRCPPSPVMRAKEGFFQLLREKKRDFDSRLDYDLLWLRELKEEVERAVAQGKPLPPSLPSTSTAARKRQRIVLEAREAARAPRAPSTSIFNDHRKPLLAFSASPATSSSSPSRRLPSPRRIVSIAASGPSRMAATRGRRGGSIIKTLFTDAAAAAQAVKGREKEDEEDSAELDKENRRNVAVAVQGFQDDSSEADTSTMSLSDREGATTPQRTQQAADTVASASPGLSACRVAGRASPSLFEPPPNAWLRTPSPMQTMDGKGVIAVRVRKKPLPLAQQNLKKRARELGMSPLATSSPSSTVISATASPLANDDAVSPRRELLVTEDDEPVVFHMDFADEVSPGVTAAFDVDGLLDELERSRHEEEVQRDEEERRRSLPPDAEEQLIERRTQIVEEPEQLKPKPTPPPLGSFPARSDSWFTLGSAQSEAETVLSALKPKLNEVSLGSNHESEVERRSFARAVSMEVVCSALQELNELQHRRCEEKEEEAEEQKIVATSSPREAKRDKANSPTSGRRSRIIEREERLRQIDVEREKIKRRRMEREKRRRESDLGGLASAIRNTTTATATAITPATASTTTVEDSASWTSASVNLLDSELRQSAPVSLGEGRRTRVTTPPSSPRRGVLANITPSASVSASTSASASPRRAKKGLPVPKLDIAKVKALAGKPGPSSPTSPSLLRNSRTPAATTASDARRMLRAESARRAVVTVPQPSTTSLAVRERLQAEPLRRTRATAVTPAAKATTVTVVTKTRRREPSPEVAKKATAATVAKKRPQAEEKKIDGDNAGCETVLAYSSLGDRKIADAFLEAIAKEKREREEREREEKKVRGSVLPYPIPAPGSPSSSFIIMSPAKRKSMSSDATVATSPMASPSMPSSSTTSGSPPKKRKLENGESASSSANESDGTKLLENVASAQGKSNNQPRPKEMWRGEAEGTLRARQHREREDIHLLYGLDAELARKSEEKLKPEIVREAVVWVYRAARGNTKGSVLMPASSRGVAGLFDCLKSGRLLCEVANKVRPGIIPKIHIRPIPLMEQENVKMYLAACERMGMRKADLFVVSDLYEEKYLPAVLQNVICLSRLASSSSSFSGPHLRL